MALANQVRVKVRWKWVLGGILILGLVSILALAGGGDRFMGSLLGGTNNSEGFTLSINQTEQLLVGDSVQVALQVHSPQQVSKVVASLYYDPKVLQYQGYTENTNAYSGYILAQVRPEAGWLYFADGRKNSSTPPAGETFVTLSFQAIAPGSTALRLDPDISKFGLGNTIDPYPLKNFTAIPDVVSTILPPAFTLTHTGSKNLTKPEATFDIAVANLSSKNRITGYKVREGTAAWSTVTTRAFETSSQRIPLSDVDGVKNIAFMFQDSFGNWYESRSQDTATVYATTLFLDRKGPDIAKPSLVIQRNGTWIPAGSTNTTTPSIAWRFASTDTSGIGKQTLRIKKDSSIVSSQDVPATSTGAVIQSSLTEGSYTAEVEVEDTLGNRETGISEPFIIDTTPPTLGATPLTLKSPVSERMPILGYTISDNALESLHIKIMKDGTQIHEQTSRANPEQIIAIARALNNDTYQVMLSATDAAGNSSPSTKVMDLTIQSDNAGTSTAISGGTITQAQLEQARKDLARINSEIILSGQDLQRLNNEIIRAQTRPPATTPTTTTPAPQPVTSRTTPPVSLGNTTTQSFRDIDSSHWAWSYVDRLQRRGVLAGYSDGSIRPNNEITRAEFLKMVLTANNTPTSGSPSVTFTDTLTGDWYASYVNTAVALKIVGGYNDGSLRPNNSITRAEAIKVLLVANNITPGTSTSLSFRDITGTEWFVSYIEAAQRLNIVQGYSDNTFRPYQPITRAEAAKIVTGFLQ